MIFSQTKILTILVFYGTKLLVFAEIDYSFLFSLMNLTRFLHVFNTRKNLPLDLPCLFYLISCQFLKQIAHTESHIVHYILIGHTLVSHFMQCIYCIIN